MKIIKELAIIGASYLQLPLVKKAKEMGIETHCFAWREGAVCTDRSRYLIYQVSTEKERDMLKEKINLGGGKFELKVECAKSKVDKRLSVNGSWLLSQSFDSAWSGERSLSA